MDSVSHTHANTLSHTHTHDKLQEYAHFHPIFKTHPLSLSLCYINTSCKYHWMRMCLRPAAHKTYTHFSDMTTNYFQKQHVFECLWMSDFIINMKHLSLNLSSSANSLSSARSLCYARQKAIFIWILRSRSFSSLMFQLSHLSLFWTKVMKSSFERWMSPWWFWSSWTLTPGDHVQRKAVILQSLWTVEWSERNWMQLFGQITTGIIKQERI